jgi:archaellum component FlaG (FlaF/FlaG flagellin family)
MRLISNQTQTGANEMSDKSGIIMFVGALIFAILFFGALTYQEQKRNSTVAEMTAKGTNPILARCAIDASYSMANTTLCSDALKKETK